MSQANKAISFVKKHKKKFIIGGIIYLVLMIGVIVGAIIMLSGDSYTDDYAPPEDQYPRVDVNGLSVQEACSRLQEKGWKIESVYGNTEDYSDTQVSDCDKAKGTVNDVNYYGDSLSLYYVYEKDTASTTVTKQEKKKSEAPKPKTRFTVSENAAEHFCQDAGLLNKYVDSSKISTIYASNYGKKYTDSFSYDKEGNPIWFIQWNGKNKSSGEATRFSCWISGDSDDNITLHWLSLDGVDLYGQAGFEQYKENGDLRR